MAKLEKRREIGGPGRSELPARRDDRGVLRRPGIAPTTEEEQWGR